MTTPDYAHPADIRAALKADTIAVVGLSPNPSRPSHDVAAYLQRVGYRIIPINPSEQSILGERCYGSLLDVPDPIQLVDVFRKPEATPAIAKEAVAIGARCLWLQLDVISEEAAEIALRGGLSVVMDRCTKIEHAHLQQQGLLPSR